MTRPRRRAMSDDELAEADAADRRVLANAIWERVMHAD
jgi:hypothetical protein